MDGTSERMPVGNKDGGVLGMLLGSDDVASLGDTLSCVLGFTLGFLDRDLLGRLLD